jgi:hypothetical protein
LPGLKQISPEHGAAHFSAADFRRGLNGRQMLAQQPRFLAAGANVHHLERLAGQQ